MPDIQRLGSLHSTNETTPGSWRSELRMLALSIACGIVACTGVGGDQGSSLDEETERLQREYASLDSDGDRRVQLAELDLQSQAYMKAIDAGGNRDGEIQFDEYQQFMADPQGASKSPIPASVELREDLAYADTSHHRQRLDLYLPRRPVYGESGLPVVVYIHGGGWYMGDKVMGRPQLIDLVRTGRFAGVSAGYRLSGDAIFPAQVHDTKAVIRWVRAHATQYGWDPSRIGVIGASAGGHLVAMLGTSGGAAFLEGNLGLYGSESSRVQCVIDLFGASDLVTRARNPASRADYVETFLGRPPLEDLEWTYSASPVTYVTKDDPPFLIIHGSEDRVVFPEQSRILERALRKAEVPVRLEIIEGAGHGLNMGPEHTIWIRDFFIDCLGATN